MHTSIPDQFENQMVAARLTGGTIVIPTGSRDPKVWALRQRFSMGDGYVRIEEGDNCFLALQPTFQTQYHKINDLAKTMVDCGLTHGWIAPEGKIKGRNFMFIVGELYAPLLIWRRMGAGTQVYNNIFFRNEKLSVGDFLNQ